MFSARNVNNSSIRKNNFDNEHLTTQSVNHHPKKSLDTTPRLPGNSEINQMRCNADQSYEIDDYNDDQVGLNSTY